MKKTKYNRITLSEKLGFIIVMLYSLKIIFSTMEKKNTHQRKPTRKTQWRKEVKERLHQELMFYLQGLTYR